MILNYLQINIFIDIYNVQVLQMLAKKVQVYLAKSRRKILRGFEKVEHCSSEMMHLYCCNNCKHRVLGGLLTFKKIHRPRDMCFLVQNDMGNNVY